MKKKNDSEPGEKLFSGKKKGNYKIKVLAKSAKKQKKMIRIFSKCSRM